LLENQQGAIYVEYAFLVAFIAMAAAGGVILLGERLALLFEELAENVDEVHDAMEELIDGQSSDQLEFLTGPTDWVNSHVSSD
jgi:Flp pilus assembly pilin Flp